MLTDILDPINVAGVAILAGVILPLAVLPIIAIVGILARGEPKPRRYGKHANRWAERRDRASARFASRFERG